MNLCLAKRFLCCCRWIVLALAIGGGLSCSTSSSASRKIAPEFSLPTRDGQVISLSEQRGQVVLLNFWAAWCAPCRREVPILNDLQQRFRDQDFRLLGVAVSSTRLSAELWVENLQVSYPVVFTGEEHQELLKQYGVDQGIPFSVLIDSQGHIYKTYKGIPEDPQVFSQDIETLLAMN